MKSVKRIMGFAALTLLLAIACTNDKSTETGAATANPADSAAKIIPVNVQSIRVMNIERPLDYTANLIPFEEINFAPASPGRIKKIYVEIGDRVKKGQLLVEMDKTQLSQAAVQYQTAKTTFERVDTLYQLGSISEQQYDQTKTQYEVAKSSYEFLSENTTMIAPINGIVTGKYFEDGELYSGAPNTMAGKAAVLTLMQIHPMKAVVSISQTYFLKVKEGMEATITCDIFPDEVFTGSIYKVYPTIDQATRSFKTEILISNPRQKLRPGMFGKIEINLGMAKALVVPAIAVLKQEGTNNRYVFLNENGTAKRVDVTPGRRFDDLIEITGEGIEEGAELVVEGQANLLNGTKVRVVKE